MGFGELGEERGGGVDVSAVAMDLDLVEADADLVFGIGVVGGGEIEEAEGGIGVAVTGGVEAHRFEDEGTFEFFDGVGEAIVEDLGFASAPPFDRESIGFEGGIFVFGVVTFREFLEGFEGAIEWVTDGDIHPGDGGQGHVIAFDEGVALEEAGVKDVVVVGEIEVGFVDVAKHSGGTFVEEGTDPVVFGGAEGIRAKGVEVRGDGAGAEAELGIKEGAVDVAGIPAEVNTGIAHGEVGAEAGDVSIEDHGDAFAGVCVHGIEDPLVPLGVFLGEIEVGDAPEAFFFGFNGIGDHTLGDVEGGTIDAADKDHTGEAGLEEGDVFIEVGVGDGARLGGVERAEHGEFGIDTAPGGFEG